MENNLKKFDSFISYVKEDVEHVKRIYNDLTSVKPTGAGLNIWYDRYKINNGDNIKTKIKEELNKSKSAILFVSDTYLKCGRKWIEMEAKLAFEQNKEDKDFKIFIILYKISNEKISNNNIFKFLADFHSDLIIKNYDDLPNIIIKIEKYLHDNNKNYLSNYSLNSLRIENNVIKMETLDRYVDGIKSRIINLFQSHGVDLFNIGSFIGQKNFKISSLYDNREFIDNIDYKLLKTLAETFRVTYEWISFELKGIKGVRFIYSLTPDCVYWIGKKSLGNKKIDLIIS